MMVPRNNTLTHVTLNLCTFLTQTISAALFYDLIALLGKLFFLHLSFLSSLTIFFGGLLFYSLQVLYNYWTISFIPVVTLLYIIFMSFFFLLLPVWEDSISLPFLHSWEPSNLAPISLPLCTFCMLMCCLKCVI